MVSSIVSPTTISCLPPPIPSHEQQQQQQPPGSNGGEPSGRTNGSDNDAHKVEASHETAIIGGGAVITICMTVFIFRAEPDLYSTRHVLMYFTSPDLPDFHETVHSQRMDAKSPDWFVDRQHSKADWVTERNYANHVNAGAVLVAPGQEMVPVEVVAAIPTKQRDGEWNCQHFLYEGLQALVDGGFQTQEWYDAIEDEMMDKIFDGTVG